MAANHVVIISKQLLWLSIIICCLSSFSIKASCSSVITTQTLEFSASGRVVSLDRKGQFTPSRHVHNQRNKKGGFQAELIHRDSPFSPLSKQNTSRLERLRLAVRRSIERAQALSKAAMISANLHTSSLSDNQTSKLSTHDFNTPLASANGAYVMTLQFGTPPQTFEAIADTGSDLVWIQCKPCSRCYRQKGPIFSPASSSSYSKLSCSTRQCHRLSTGFCDGSSSTCQYVYGYGDQSGSKGVLSTETISFKTTGGSTDQHIPRFGFGCGNTNVGSFGGAGGIVGMGQGPLSLISQLGDLIQNRFSYCLVNFDDAPSKTSPLLFGSAASLPESGVKSTPILRKGSTYYYVGLGGFSVGGQKVRASMHMAGGTIFDSGTTLTLLQESAYSAVRSAFHSAITLPPADGSSVGLDLCYDVTGLKSYRVPILSLHFTNSDLNPPAENYLVLADSNTLCLAIASSSGLALSIIGNLMQQNFHILYDRGTSTISFAPTQCDNL